MTGTLRMTVAATKHLVRGRDVLIAALVVPLVVLGILALFADLDFDTGHDAIGFTELMVTGAGVTMVAASPGRRSSPWPLPAATGSRTEKETHP